MDQKTQKPASDKDIGTVVVFLIVLISALLMMRYDRSGWLANLRSNAQEQVVAVPPVPPL